MKIVKKSISLPEDLYKFAEKRAAELAGERGSSRNVSQYFRELVAKEREKVAGKLLKQAA
jgi:hypothetical protein